MDFEVVKMDSIKSPKIFFFLEMLEDIDRNKLLHLFTARDRYFIDPGSALGADFIKVKLSSEDNLPKDIAYHVGKGVSVATKVAPDTPNQYVYGAIHNDGTHEILLVKIADDSSVAPITTGTKFYLTKDMIVNYNEDDPVVTDAGKFLANKMLLAEPFGSYIPYINAPFKPGAVDKLVANGIMEGDITREMYNKYMNNGYWLLNDGSIFVPTWSERSITTTTEMEKKKKELFDKYRDQLDDPLVVSKIEDELIALDKEYLKGDVSEPFYAVDAGKKLHEQRKKLYMTFGLAVAFDKNSGKYELVEHSLNEGWDASSIAVASNDIRRGSYNRGVETAKGGEQTKFVLRIFQDTEIQEDDCGSTDGITIELTDKNYGNFIDRYLTNGEKLTDDNKSKYIGKTVNIRSPMYCKSKPGFCYKCAGDYFKKTDNKAIGMLALYITATFTATAMKAMHVSGITSTKINDFNKFLR